MEFPQLGGKCSKPSCKVLDFLPAKCSYCCGVFCGDHLSPFVHDCEQFKDNLLTDSDLEKRERVKWQVKCTLESCKVKELLPLECAKCMKHFCLQHRHPDQHQCLVYLKEEEEKEFEARKALKASEAGQEAQNRIQQEIATRLEEAKSAGGAKGAMATKLTLIKLKGRTKIGESSIPTEERVYFTVHCLNKGEDLDVWMWKEWTLGKAIDFMGKQAGIKNRNNVKDDEPKLHLFKDDKCISNPSDRKICEIIEEGVIVDGDKLLFKHCCVSHTDMNKCPIKEEKMLEAKKAQSGQQLHNQVKQEIATRLEEAKSAGGAKAAMATKLALMKLKGRAKGDQGVPVGERIFFSVDCPNKEQNPNGLDVWMSKGWTLGKAIDFMARQARIKNKNNVKDAPKLHLYKDDKCISKPSDRKISEIVDEGVIVDGDKLQFKLIPAEEP